MSASFLSLPFELREKILTPILRQIGTIELQYPVWADRSVFVDPVTQVCRSLRHEAIEVFYRNNVFVWVIDPEEDNRPDPTQYPLALRVAKDMGPTGPLVSCMPWYYPDLMEDLRHLRLNIYLPPSHDKGVWTDPLPRQLAGLVETLDRGVRLKDLKILIGTWHKILKLTSSQAAVFDILRRMEVRGTVQVRTKSVSDDAKADIRSLDLERLMRCNGPVPARSAADGVKNRPGGKYLDWEWEGGGLLA